ncbi:MAG: flagellar transcriptional regulator FlhC [Burkholderiales bacterium]
MRMKSVVTDAGQVQLAIDLVRLGARLQVLESETGLSRERLLKLYKEVKGMSPPKGMLPFSTDWFMSWMPNIHSSMFLDTYRYLCAHTQTRGITVVMTAYRLYLEHLHVNKLDAVLSFTRAWSLVRFFEANMLSTAPCRECGGEYVVHAMDLHDRFVCGLCHVPSRAGKTRQMAVATSAAALGARQQIRPPVAAGKSPRMAVTA